MQLRGEDLRGGGELPFDRWLQHVSLWIESRRQLHREGVRGLPRATRASSRNQLRRRRGLVQESHERCLLQLRVSVQRTHRVEAIRYGSRLQEVTERSARADRG